MRSAVLVAMAASAALAGCAGDHRLEVTGTVVQVSDPMMGLPWVIRTDDGKLYEPRPFPEEISKVGLRVRARLAPNPYFYATGQVGVAVVVEEASPVQCAPESCAPAPVAWLYVGGYGRYGGAGPTTAANVTGPAGTPAPTASCAPILHPVDASLTIAMCTVSGPGAGSYDLDLSAPGFEPLHVTIDVPAQVPPDYPCCPQPYPTQALDLWLRELP